MIADTCWIVDNHNTHGVLHFLTDLNEIIDNRFKLNLAIDGWGISCEIAFRWMSLDPSDDTLKLVQAMD